LRKAIPTAGACVVPYAPGGPTDVVTRLIAQKLSERSGKQFYVENIGGGAATSPWAGWQDAPDGYTLLMVNPSYVVNPTLYRDRRTDSKRTSIRSRLAVLTTLVIDVHPSVPARTLQELVALIKANPGKYSYASPGSGHSGSSRRRSFRSSLGLDLVHVPFNSAGWRLVRRSGAYPICFASPSPAAQQVIEGKLRGLAVTSVRVRRRYRGAYDCEAGYPAVAGDNWQGIVVPSGTTEGDDSLHPSRDCRRNIGCARKL
jgi:tripartite-type tricarboxylate transporter receptor subunit TctC